MRTNILSVTDSAEGLLRSVFSRYKKVKSQDWTEVEMTRNEIATEASIYFMSCQAGIDLQKSSELMANSFQRMMKTTAVL